MNQTALKKAEEWCKRNAAMPSLETPVGYKSEYLYQQAVVYKEKTPNDLPFGSALSEKEGWGIVSVVSDHELLEKDLKSWKSAFEKHSLQCVGVMRLVKQTFSWDSNERA